MRRMYSEKELTTIINQVVGEYIEAGALDESIADAVDAYLVEHPVDITALEGLDISVKSITATDGIDYGQLVDEDGHERFIIDDGIPSTITGVTFSYYKWSLSGTHLMIVLAGTIENGTEFTTNTELANFQIPSWIGDKIYPVWATYSIELKVIDMRDNSWGSQTFNCVLQKTSGTNLRLTNLSNVTLSSDKGFRIQFDLLID